MIAAWMLYAAVVVSLVAGATAVLASLRQQLGRSSRWVWMAGLMGAAALVLTAPLRVTPLSSAPLEVPVATPTVPAVEASAPTDRWIDRVAATRDAARAWLTARFAVVANWPARVQWSIASVWMASSLGVAAVFALVMIGMHRRRARWPYATLDDVRIRVTDGVGPMVVGVANAEIALPPWIIALPPSARRLVLAHEVEHQRARDPLLLTLGGLAVLIVPWHPLSWWMLRRLGAAVELDCDARVLRRGVAAREYGLLLLDIASRSRPRSLLTPWPTLGVSSHLERRLLAMTKGAQRVPMSRTMLVSAVASALVLVACESKLPTSAEVEAMDGRKVVESQKALLTEVPARYTIDGRAATRADVEALPAGRIAEVAVSKSTGAGAPGEVAITTRASGAVVEDRATQPRGGVVFLKDSTQPSGYRTMTGNVVELREVPIGPDGKPTGFVTIADSASAARVVAERRTPPSGIVMSGASTFSGILLIDGVERPESAMRSLLPDQIERVEVVKGPAARQRFPNDPRAEQGAIFITTKAGRKN